MGAEHVVLVRGGEARRDDSPVAPVGAQDHHVVAAQPCAHDERVQRVGLAAPAPDGRDRLREPLAVPLAVELGVVDQHPEVVQVGAVVAVVETGRHLLHDGQPERLEHGQELAQRDLAAVRRDRHARERPRARLRVGGQLVLQPDGELLARRDALQQGDVDDRQLGRGGGLVVVGQPGGVERDEPAALGVAVLRDQLVGEAVVPRARQPGDLLLELLERHLGRALGGHVQEEEELGRGALDEREVVLHRLGVVARREQLLQAQAQLGRHAVARHRHHDGHVAVGGVPAHGERDALRLLGARRRDDLGAQRLDGGLEQLVARERLERGDGCLVVVRALDQALGLDDRVQLAAQERRARGLLEVDERGEQADHAQQAGERAVGPQDAHRHVVHASAPVHARDAVRLADHEQIAVRGEPLAQELRQLVERRGLGEAGGAVVAQDAEPRAELNLHRRARRAARSCRRRARRAG